MEQTIYVGVKPTAQNLRDIGDLVHESTRRVLEEGVKLHESGEHGEIYAHLARLHSDYLETGDLPAITLKLNSVTRGTRITTSSDFIWPYDPEALNAIDDDDVTAFSITFASSYGQVNKLELAFDGYTTTLRLDTFGSDAGVLSFAEVDAFANAAFPPLSEGESLGPVRPFRVFMGHGNDHQWRVLRDDLHDHHGFDFESFEGSPRAGMTMRDVIQDMAMNSTAAVLVLTRADEQMDGSWNARQNVIHELGYFQAHLGWDRAILVVEDGVTVPSNLAGTQQVRYRQGAIEGAVGGVVAVLTRLRTEHERSAPGTCP